MTDRLRIAVVSSGDERGLGGAIARGLREGGNEARLVPEPSLRAPRAARLALELGGALPEAAVDVRRCTRELERSPTDLVIVVKGVFTSPDTVRKMRERCPVVCWNPDSPFDHAPSNHGGMVHPALTAYDAYVTWAHDVASALRDLRDRVCVVPFGIDDAIHPAVADDPRATGRVVLVGTATRERAELVARLHRARPLVFGNGWHRTGIEALPPVYGDEFAAVVRAARWCLNPLRPQNRSSHNMRTFELAGCGAAQLTYDTADHRRFLAASRSVLVTSTSDLVRAVEGEPPAHISISMAEHSYRARCDALLAELRALGLLADEVPRAS